MTNFLDKWKRSPRQDRRVVINGVFYEQAPVQYPEPEPEETVEQVGGFQIVTEVTDGTDTGTSAGNDVPDNGPNSGDNPTGRNIGAEEGTSVRRKGEIVTSVPDSPIPSPGPSVSEKSQAELEPIDAVAEHIKGSITVAEIAEAVLPLPKLPESAFDALTLLNAAAQEASGVLPTVSENTDGKDVLDGQARRVEDDAEPMTNTTEIGGGYVAAEITRESLA